MEKITRTWSLMSECWQVLKQDKKLLVFPASFAIPIYLTGAWVPPGHDAAQPRQLAYYGTLFAFYVGNYFIVVFFNAAIVASAALRLSGGQPTLGDGLRAAAARLPVIAGWALVLATVGLVLRLIEDRSEKVGRIVAGILGMAWTMVSFFVVPILVIENKGPMAALKDSTGLLKKTWGEQVTSSFSFGLLFMLLALPAFGLIVLGFFLGHAVALFACIGVAVIYLLGLALVQSALQSIFQTALYLYARDGQVPAGFSAEVLKGALS